MNNDATLLSQKLSWFPLLLKIAIGLFFMLMAVRNLSGDQQMVSDFARWGYPDWFRIVTGVLQLGGAMLFLIPATSFYGAGLLSCILVGAIFTHLKHDPLVAAISPLAFIIFTATFCFYSRPDFLR